MSKWHETGQPHDLKHGTWEHKLFMGALAFVLFILFSQWWFALPVAAIAFILGAIFSAGSAIG